MANDIIGRQMSFPVGLSDRNQLALVGGDAAIRQSIYIIINTVPGERVMRPDFGCLIHELIFAPANDETAILAERYVREALERWEPRIELEEVKVEPQVTRSGIGALVISVAYSIRGGMDARELVVPYYLDPEIIKTGDDLWA